MNKSFYIYETQFKPSCWSCGHWVIGGGCFKDKDNVRPTDHDDYCEDWVKEGSPGTVTSDAEAPSKRAEISLDDLPY